MKNKIYTLLIVFCFVLVSGCVSQQDMLNIQNRLTALESQGSSNLSTYNQVGSRIESFESQIHHIKQSQDLIEKQFREQYAGVKANSNTSRHEIRQITGRLEEIEYHLKKKFNVLKQSKGKTDQGNIPLDQINARLKKIETYLGLEANGIPKNPAPAKQTDPVEKTPEALMYNKAKKAFDSNDFETARIQFVNFLKKYPQSSDADNAQFWMGEIYYREKWYEKAILEYQKVIEEYPAGNKVPSALLKQGMAFLELNDKTNASLILKELTKKFPDASESKLAEKKLNDL
ncbi:tol-pal system protein YbgF [Candidatus Magnetomorum sp. HK-1]|nr:tol-pal system protein YbgF [Candidatus Magnetomorum sp. HK-1]